MASIDAIDYCRKHYWVTAAIRFAISRFYKGSRKPNNWVFGAWHGGKYDDNSRYLFEYVNHYCPNIQATWLSNNQSVVKEVRRLGFKAEIADSDEGITCQKTAGFAFYTNGIDDFSYKPSMLGAQIVALWHAAIGQKNTWHMNDHSTGIKHELKAMKSRMFEWVYRDFTCAVSEYCAELKKEAFLIKPGTIHVTGQPRNDELLHRAAEANSKEGMTVLYMPTHGPSRASYIEKTLKFFCSSEFSQVLKSHNARVIVKLHFLTSIDESISSPYVEVINGDTDRSSQDLLADASILVTDYSSCAIDFAILNRPILLYIPDFVAYTDEQDIGEDWLDLYSRHGIRSPKLFLESLTAELTGQLRDLTVTHWINERYLDQGTLDADSEFPFCVSTIRALVEQYPRLGDYIQVTPEHSNVFPD